MKISGSECQAHRTIRRQFGISKQASSKPLCFCSTAFNRMLFLTRGNFLLAANQTNTTIRRVCTFICQSINLLYECYSIIKECTCGISYVNFYEFVSHHVKCIPQILDLKHFILMRCLCTVSSIKISNLKTKSK